MATPEMRLWDNRYIDYIQHFVVNVFHEQNHRLLFKLLPGCPQAEGGARLYLNTVESLVITTDYALCDQLGREAETFCQAGILYRAPPLQKKAMDWRRNKRFYRNCLKTSFFVTYFRLWSRTLKREVLIQHTSAKAIEISDLPIYAFLVLQSENRNRASINWSWGSLEELSHLPRITYRNVILAKARWRLSPSQVQRLLLNKGKDLEIPKWVTIGDNDQKLVIDLETQTGKEVLRRHWLKSKNKKHLVLTEAYPSSSWRGRFAATSARNLRSRV